MNDEVVPAINLNIEKIKAFPAEIEKAKIETVNKIKTEINIYVRDNVMPPIIKMGQIFETLGDGVKHDITIVGQQSINLITTLKTEAKAIQTEFIGFGTDVKKESTDIAEGMVRLSKEMIDAIKEIKPTMENAIIHGKRINSRRKRNDWLGAFSSAYTVVKRFLWEGVEGNDGILPEVMEAFLQISSAAKNLRNQFQDFGGILNYRTSKISNQVEASGANISGEMTALTNSLKGLFGNMSNRIKGGTGQVLKAIEYQDIEAKEIALYETSEQIIAREEAEAVIIAKEEAIIAIEEQRIQAGLPQPTIQTSQIAPTRTPYPTTAPPSVPIITITPPTLTPEQIAEIQAAQAAGTIPTSPYPSFSSKLKKRLKR